MSAAHHHTQDMWIYCICDIMKQNAQKTILRRIRQSFNKGGVYDCTNVYFTCVTTSGDKPLLSVTELSAR